MGVDEVLDEDAVWHAKRLRQSPDCFPACSQFRPTAGVVWRNTEKAAPAVL
jgi:hypothetical protein